jgi:hypothetical protein
MSLITAAERQKVVDFLSGDVKTLDVYLSSWEHYERWKAANNVSVWFHSIEIN